MYTIPCVSFHSKNTHKRGIISNHFIYSYIYIHGYIHHQSAKEVQIILIIHASVIMQNQQILKKGRGRKNRQYLHF